MIVSKFKRVVKWQNSKGLTGKNQRGLRERGKPKFPFFNPPK